MFAVCFVRLSRQPHRAGLANDVAQADKRLQPREMRQWTSIAGTGAMWHCAVTSVLQHLDRSLQPRATSSVAVITPCYYIINWEWLFKICRSHSIYLEKFLLTSNSQSENLFVSKIYCIFAPVTRHWPQESCLVVVQLQLYVHFDAENQLRSLKWLQTLLWPFLFIMEKKKQEWQPLTFEQAIDMVKRFPITEDMTYEERLAQLRKRVGL